MEFYGTLVMYRTVDGHLFVPVTGFFKVQDEIEIFINPEEPKAIRLRRADRSNISKFLRGSKMLETVKKTRDGLWLSMPKWAWEAAGSAEFFIGIDRANFSEDGMPREIVLYPVPRPQELTVESRFRFTNPEPELKIIDVSREQKAGISAGVVEKVPTDARALSQEMLRSAFGPEFDQSLGVPKAIR